MGGEACGVFYWWFRGRSIDPKYIKLSMIIFAPIMLFLATFVSILLSLLIEKKWFSFEPCATKLVVVK